MLPHSILLSWRRMFASSNGFDAKQRVAASRVRYPSQYYSNRHFHSISKHRERNSVT